MNADFMRIVDVIAATDGGAELCYLKDFIDVMESRAIAGNDYAAEELLKIVHTFRKLVDIAVLKGGL